MPAGDTTYGHDATTGQVQLIIAPGGIGLQFQWDGFLPIRTDWSGPVSGTVSRDFDNNFWLSRETVNGVPVAFDYDDDELLTGAGDLTIGRDTANGLITGTMQQAIEGTRDYNGFGELNDRSVTAETIKGSESLKRIKSKRSRGQSRCRGSRVCVQAIMGGHP